MKIVRIHQSPFTKVTMALLFAAYFLLSSISPIFAADEEVQNPHSFNRENVESFLQTFFTSPEVAPYYVGASIVIVQDDEIITQQGYGYADLEKEIPVDPSNTRFRLASVSKTFTAMAIMQLVEQGKVDLHADIRTYLHGIEWSNPYDVPVTVEHLLTHETGFEVRDPKAEDLHTDYDKFVEIEDYIRHHMPPVVRMPGSSYMYDNFAYLLLGLIVQNVSGQPYEDYMNDHVFTPLNMQKSSFLLNEAILDELATGYDPGNQPIEKYTFSPTIMPHGGLISTAEDVGQWIIALLNADKTPTDSILSEESIQSMMTYRSAIHPLMPNSTYGFEAASQFPGSGSSMDIITKAGDLPGNSSHLILIPEKKIGVFLTYNKQGVLREIFYQQFMMTFFPEYITPVDQVLEQVATAEELQLLSGLYSDLRVRILISSITVADDGQLVISDAFLGPRTLHQVGEHLFVDELTGQFTAFTLDEQSGEVYMKEPYLNPMGYARKSAQPAGFIDIETTHPYKSFIHDLQSLGYYSNEAGQRFQPEREVSRGEFVKDLLEASMIEASHSTEWAFSDIDGHPYAGYIHAAYELGMVNGDGDGQFLPDRAITRQEGAVIVWNILHLQYPGELFAHINIEDEVADWADQAVKMMFVLGLYGPEVQISTDDSIRYLAEKTLTRQETAALLYKLLTQPTDLIVSQLLEQQTPDATEPSKTNIDPEEDIVDIQPETEVTQ